MFNIPAGRTSELDHETAYECWKLKTLYVRIREVQGGKDPAKYQVIGLDRVKNQQGQVIAYKYTLQDDDLKKKPKVCTTRTHIIYPA